METEKYITEKLEQIQIRLDDLLQIVQSKQQTKPEEVFFDNQEFIQIMNISKRTAQQWRFDRIVSYSQIGNKFYYTLADILLLLKVNYKSSFNIPL